MHRYDRSTQQAAGSRQQAELESRDGRVLGVDDAGALLLATAQGQQAVHAGEVTLASSYETLGGAVSKN